MDSKQVKMAKTYESGYNEGFRDGERESRWPVLVSEPPTARRERLAEAFAMKLLDQREKLRITAHCHFDSNNALLLPVHLDGGQRIWSVTQSSMILKRAPALCSFHRKSLSS